MYVACSNSDVRVADLHRQLEQNEKQKQEELQALRKKLQAEIDALKSQLAKVRRLFTHFVECSYSGVELRTLDYENPGLNPGCGIKTLGKYFHSTLLQFTQLFK